MIAWQTDDALDVGLRRIARQREHDELGHGVGVVKQEPRNVQRRQREQRAALLARHLPSECPGLGIVVEEFAHALGGQRHSLPFSISGCAM